MSWNRRCPVLSTKRMVSCELMAALTGDNRFEEMYHQSRQEGVEVKNMCEILDKVENRGVQRGLEQGLEQGLEKKLIVQIKKKIHKNKSISEIADALEETEEDVQKIYDAIIQMGVDTPDGEIYKRLHTGAVDKAAHS